MKFTKHLKIFIGSSYKNKPTGELIQREVQSFEEFCTTYLKICRQGVKNEHYITIGDEYDLTLADKNQHPNSYKYNDHFHRNNVSQKSAWLLPFDGDSSYSDKNSCVPPVEVHEILKKLNYTHVIYTTHSHFPPKHRWRLFIPCKMTDKRQLTASMMHLLKEINHPDLKLSNESKTWSIPWYLPTRDDPDDGLFKYYEYHEGRPFTAVDGVVDTYDRDEEEKTDKSDKSARSVESMIEIIKQGAPNTGLHEATRDLAMGFIKDGLKPRAVKAILHQFTDHYSMSDPRQKENKEKINDLVDSAWKNLKLEKTAESNCNNSKWAQEISTNKRIFTEYPDLGGRMEEMVQEYMEWCLYPKRQTAVLAVRALISTMGGRIYALPGGGGISLTALMTVRSTGGKSFLKQYINWVLTAGRLESYTSCYVGAQLYTSAKNFIADYLSKNSLLAIRTESGQSDKSNSGDMSRVLLYELEASTNSGPKGYISAGGQNKQDGKEVLPALYSPSISTVRESVAKIQNDADIINQSVVSGAAGRRSVVIVDPIQPYRNNATLEQPSKETIKLINFLHQTASEEERKNPLRPMSKEKWIQIKYEDPEYLVQREKVWTDKNNAAFLADDEITATLYGRLGERIPAFAACSAIVENPRCPIITSKQLQVAEQCLINEHYAVKQVSESGESDGPWPAVETKVKEIFSGDLTKHVKRYPTGLQEEALKELKDGCLGMSPLSIILQHFEPYKIVKNNSGFTREFESRLENLDICKLSPNESFEMYGHRRKTFKRK